MIYGIGDLHFDYSKSKPMDIFGDNWVEHEEQIINNWKDIVKDEDLVLIPGDISWALKLNEAYDDLKRVDKLPGKKILSKGNHDYWWQSLKKINDLGLKSLYFIQNTSYIYDNISISGTRGWSSRDSNDFDESDEKVFRRELLRLEMSLNNIKEEVDTKIVMLHYPPFNNNREPNEFVELMKEQDVDICVYGHLHAEGHKHIVEGNISDIDFYCISSDYIKFIPKLIIGE
ncbi:MAG TPA: metallophosphoesterase [Tissierellaceae bacterium]|nr:metallophosphoesterase [Tissierellaceae bacterium]